MANVAPIPTATVVAVLMRTGKTSVLLAIPEEHAPALRTWAWGTDRYHRGRTLGSRFRLTLDGVSIEGDRVTAWPNRKAAEMLVCLTGDTAKAKSAGVFGYHVGQVIREAKLERVETTDKRQTVIRATSEVAMKPRVTVEVEAVT